jgi:hypothetical protein
LEVLGAFLVASTVNFKPEELLLELKVGLGVEFEFFLVLGPVL